MSSPTPRRRSRRRQLFVINRRWSVGLAASVLAVVVGLVLIGALGGAWTYAGLVLAGLGAVTAMLQTFVRSHAGDEIDEAEL